MACGRVSSAPDEPCATCIIFISAPVAQLDRAIASGAIGREFESLRARQFDPSTPLRVAQDFGRRLALRSRRLGASSSNLSGRASFDPSTPLRVAQDFGRRLALRSRRLNASSSNLSGRASSILRLPFGSPRISTDGSRCAHAVWAPQVRTPRARQSSSCPCRGSAFVFHLSSVLIPLTR